jgi:predicted PolB exonuclease-like 3'-5' exonuclease
MSDDVVLVFDIEAVPDAAAFAAAERMEAHPLTEVRRQMGEKVARQLFQRIVCIGWLVARRDAAGTWRPEDLQAPWLDPASSSRTEPALIRELVDRIAALEPRLVTFNGHTFDLPVLRYRALMHSIAAPGLAARPYFDRNGQDAVDLCDLLSAQERHARVSLDELSRALGLPGKPRDTDGAQVEAMFAAGRHQEIADYCRSDVVNTYRCWLRYELFCGRLDRAQFDRSEAALKPLLVPS